MLLLWKGMGDLHILMTIFFDDFKIFKSDLKSILECFTSTYSQYATDANTALKNEM